LKEFKNNLFTTSVPCPKYKSDIVVSLNNVGKWHRYLKSKIMNHYKDTLKQWHIPDTTISLDKAYITFELIRHNKRVLDTDNLGFIIKWTIDSIKEVGWLKDDDQITYTAIPAVLDREKSETEVIITLYKDKESYLEELSLKLK